MQLHHAPLGHHQTPLRPRFCAPKRHPAPPAASVAYVQCTAPADVPVKPLIIDGVAYRPMTNVDRDQVKEIMLDAFYPPRTGLLAPLQPLIQKRNEADVDYYLNTMLARNPNTFVFVAQTPSPPPKKGTPTPPHEIIGCIDVTFSEQSDIIRALPRHGSAGGVNNFAYVSSIAVREDQRGKGVGGGLLEVAEQTVRVCEQDLCVIGVDGGNRAYKLYRRRGYMTLVTVGDKGLGGLMRGEERLILFKNLDLEEEVYQKVVEWVKVVRY